MRRQGSFSRSAVGVFESPARPAEDIAKAHRFALRALVGPRQRLARDISARRLLAPITSLGLTNLSVETSIKRSRHGDSKRVPHDRCRTHCRARPATRSALPSPAHARTRPCDTQRCWPSPRCPTRSYHRSDVGAHLTALLPSA